MAMLAKLYQREVGQRGGVVAMEKKREMVGKREKNIACGRREKQSITLSTKEEIEKG